MSSSQSHEILVDAILWDMDGTLINSTPAADKTYQLFCEKHNIDQSGHPHGVRMVDSMRKWFPKASDAEITDMAMQFEADIIQVAKDAVKAGQPGIVILPGVERILDELRSHPSAEQHYAICTSATRAFASSALSTAGITPPSHILAADDCTHGKPHPEPYQKGAALLSKDPKNCIVVEDAPAGIKAGLAAGATVIAVCTSHTRQQLEGLGAHHIVENLESVSTQWVGDEIKVVVKQ